MESSPHDGADDTDELLCTDVFRDFGVRSSAVPRDHCDLLLDAIDAQLSRLQTSSHGQAKGGHVKTEDVLGSVSLDRSASVSKDTGLGTDKASSAPDRLNSDHTDPTTVEPSRSGMELVGLREDERKEHVGLGGKIFWPTGDGGGDENSKREQCLWRLERLLGAGTEVTRKEEGDEEDSVRTEDFSARFLQEMLQPKKLNLTRSAPDFSAPYSVSMSSSSTVPTEPQVLSRPNADLNPSALSFKSPSRQLAGVPLKSFDLVAIDSDLDSVCTDRVRRHLQSTRTNRIAQDKEFLQNGLCSEKTIVTNTRQPENRTISSEDMVSGVCVRRYNTLRSPASVQRRQKRNQSGRTDTSTCSTASTASKGKAGDESQSEFRHVELSLADLQHQKVAAVQGVERLREEVEQSQKEQHTLHLSLTHTRTHTQLLRSELHKLQTQRNLYIQEVKALQESQAALQKHLTSVHQDFRHGTSGCASALEMEEMDRLLDNAKSELFSEQRRFRHTLDSMRERLEEVTQELEQKQEENRTLQEKRSQLEEKLTTATKTRQALQESVRSERVEQESRLRALEKIVAQKELLLLATQEEKNRLEMDLRAVREEQRVELTAALAHADKQKEVEVEQLRTQMTLTHVEELQRVRLQVHEIKEAALREQAVTHTRHTESLHNRIQIKEEELNRLQECLKQQQEELRRREEELSGETQEQVKSAVEREQRKWEEQRAESLREQQVRLEKQMQEVERREKVEADKEKRSALALQNKVLELQKSVEELKSAASKHKAVIRALKNEHQTELYKLHRQLQQESEGEAVRLKECVKRSEQELQAVRAELAESKRLQQGAAARHEQQTASWAQDVHAECVCLQELLAQNGFTVETTHLSRSVAVSEAVPMLQSLRKSLQLLISSLQNHITSLTHTNQQLCTDKEEEVRVQREQLTAEKEKAVNDLREKLIQEHVEELSRMRLRENDGDDGASARLRKQLRAKDEELRQVQRNMAQWKEKTTARLARKFTRELTSELERKSCRRKSEQRRRLEQLEDEMRHLTASSSDITDVPASSASSAHVPDTVSSQDLDSYKLLRHLQSRIRQLRADSRSDSPSRTSTSTPGSVRPSRDRWNGELAGSYLETVRDITEAQL